MLKTRLLTAAILLPAAVAWVLLTPPWAFALVAAVLVLVAAWEWAGLAGVPGAAGRAAYLATVLALMALAWSALQRPGLLAPLLWAFLGLWVLSALELASSGSQRARPFLLAQGWLVLVPAFLALLAVRREPGGAGLAFALLGIVWAADAAAYFTGRAWGRHRLAPRISPGKSWEGLAGGLAGAAGAGALAALWCPLSVWVLMPLAVATAAFSVIGDLVESRLKRRAGAKDSSRLIPGHGGLLDRIDSITAAAPIFALGLELARRAW